MRQCLPKFIKMETLKLVAAFVGAAAPAQAEHGHVGSSAKALAAGKPELIGATPEAQAQVCTWPEQHGQSRIGRTLTDQAILGGCFAAGGRVAPVGLQRAFRAHG